MKKQTMQRILLVLLPILAVGLATTQDSVTVFDSGMGVVESYSYFDLVPASNMQLVPPLAALLCVASGVLAAVYAAARKEGALKGIQGVSFCAMTLAVLPILIRGEVQVVPNVGLPILMGLEWILAYVMRKKPAKEEAPQGKRLPGR